MSYSMLGILTRRSGLRRTINGRTWRLVAACWRAFPDPWEPELDAFFDSFVKPGMVVADVGAHVGMHTLGLAKRVGQQGHVFAFEPVPNVAATLTRHLELNGLRERVTIERLAVGDRDGMEEMEIDEIGLDPGNSFVHRHYAPRRKRLDVAVTTLASYFAERGVTPHLVKLDVEGYELRALRGCAVLAQGSLPPTFACALHPWHLRQLGESEQSFFDLARDLGMTVLTLDGQPTSAVGSYREVILRPANTKARDR
jgi:FkbM family methyltransferase